MPAMYIHRVDLGLEGRVALVTAATKGIGLAIAQALATEGARVAIAARTAADVDNVARQLNGFGVPADLLTPEGGMKAVEATESALGPIEILVNNLGTRAGSSWQDTGPEHFESALDGNLVTAVRLTQLVLPGMRERKWGRVVVVSSIWGREAGGAPAYNAAKAAEISFTKSLAREVAKDGVTVNCVAPGSIRWEGGGWDRRVKADPEAMREFVEREMPLGRFGRAEEVASLVAFLCSDLASLVAGACIPVDGGQSRSNI
jgi:3-oxoacyl-[acyl-carrier protein] reductase